MKRLIYKNAQLESFIEVTTDDNDGDYITNRNSVFELTQAEIDEVILIDALFSGSHNLENCGNSKRLGDILPNLKLEDYDLIFDELYDEVISEYCPSGSENYGHTLISIVIVDKGVKAYLNYTDEDVKEILKERFPELVSK